ncbi:MAG TPA: AAA family ATPase [Dermatophilaceae bacterium]
MAERDASTGWGSLPEGVLREFDRWLGDEPDYRLILRRWFGAGRSRDRVGLVERVQGNDRRYLVMKCYGGDAEPKVRNAEKARRFNESWPHLARVLGPPVRLGSWWATFQAVAAGDLQAARPLSDLLAGTDPDPDVPAHCRAILRAVVGGWNAAAQREDGPRHAMSVLTMTNGRFLRVLLQGRLGPSGAITRWASDNGVPVTRGPATLRRAGWDRPLPNPFVLLNDMDIAERDLASPMLGWAHGDLSGRNILVSGPPEAHPAPFSLIDLDRLSEEALLVRDPMHLLVALAIDLMDAHEVGPAERTDLISAMVAPRDTGVDGLAEYMRRISLAVQEGAGAWASSPARGMGQQWREQSALALVAAALMHVGRDWFTPADREWCFRLAARATEHYFALQNTELGAEERVNSGRSRSSVEVPVSAVDGRPNEGPMASPDSASPPEEPMDDLRVCVFYDGPDGARLYRHVSMTLQHLPVDLRAPSEHHGERDQHRTHEEVAQADAVVIVETDDPTATEEQRQVADLADRRGLRVIRLRSADNVAPAGGLRHEVLLDTMQPWTDHLIAELREIGSPQYLLNVYRSQISELKERYRASQEELLLDRLQHERKLLERRAVAQQRRLENPQSTSAPALPIQRPVPSAGKVQLPRCFGEPQPTPPRVPVDRLNETRELLERLRQRPGVLTLVGDPDVGKTAMVAQVLSQLRQGPPHATVDAFVYLPARGPHLITATSVLRAIASVAPPARAAQAEVAAEDSRLTWPQKLESVLLAVEGTHVLVVLDDVQDLLDNDGDFRLPELRDVLKACIDSHEATVHVLTVGTEGPTELAPRDDSDNFTLDKGVEEEHVWDLLHSMDPDHVLRLTTQPNLTGELFSLTAGHPRVLELIVAVLHGDLDLNLAQLVADLHQVGGSGTALLRPLLTRAVESLDRTQQRVLQALAILDRPTEAASLNAILSPYLPGQTYEDILDELAHRRLLRSDGERYALPRDCRLGDLLDRVSSGERDDFNQQPMPFTRSAVYHLAARQFAPLTAEVRGDTDVRRGLAEVDILIAGGQAAKAVEAMHRLDGYLHQHGQRGLLLPSRQRVGDRLLDGGYLYVQNLASRALAHMQNDDAREAVLDLHAALSFCVDQQRRHTACRVRILLGDAFRLGGNVPRALLQYDEALADADKDWSLERGQALTGRMRCMLQHAQFQAALAEYESANEVLDQAPETVDVERTRLLLDLTRGQVLALVGNVLDARKILRAGQGQAERLGETRRVATFLGTRALVCLDTGMPAEAAQLASHAVKLGTQRNDAQSRREAATTLAQAHLAMASRTVGLPEAHAAANNAARLSTSDQAVGGFVVLGITAYRREDDHASGAFHKAESRAAHLCGIDGDNYEAHDLCGVARLGLALSEGGDGYFSRAIEAFNQSRAVASTPPIVLRTQRSLTHLVGLRDGDAQGRRHRQVGEVLAAAAGPFVDSYP